MIKHIQCDILKSGAPIICHQVNCQGAMNSGLARQIREQYPEVYESYRKVCNNNRPKDLLGTILPVMVEGNVQIINLFSQNNYGYDGKLYTNYDAMEETFDILSRVLCPGETIAFPYLLGCVRGGGDWETVYSLIQKYFEKDFNVLICEYDKG